MRVTVNGALASSTVNIGLGSTLDGTGNLSGAVAVLSGGVGGARFLRGLIDVLPQSDITVIGNVGDDLELLSVILKPAGDAEAPCWSLDALRAADASLLVEPLWGAGAGWMVERCAWMALFFSSSAAR